MRNSRRTIVNYSLGAAVSNSDGRIDLKAITTIAEQFKALVSGPERVQIVAVVGAGGLGRSYLEFAKEHLKDVNRASLDAVGIRASRVNALLLASVLRNSSIVTNGKIPENRRELESYISSGFDCIILGGIDLGMTCDSTAASIAQSNGGPLLIVSTVGGIYDEAISTQAVAVRPPLESVNRSYLRQIILQSTKGREHVLDIKTVSILLNKKSKGMKVVVTGYTNVLKATKELISAKGKIRVIKNATTIKI